MPRGTKHIHNGVTYRSGLEVRVAQQLEAAKVKFKYESEGLEYILPSRVYVPDFILTKSGVYIEAKGYLDRETQLKMLAVKAAHPDKTFVFLFSRDNPIRKGAKMKYSDWCVKYGFDYAIKEIKSEWLVKKL